MVIKPDPDVRFSPDADYKYFLFDPEGNGMAFYKTEAERDAAAETAIELSLDETWNESVDQIVAGEVTLRATQVNRKERPEKLDENGDDEDGKHWPPEIEYACGYEMLPLPEHKERL